MKVKANPSPNGSATVSLLTRCRMPIIFAVAPRCLSLEKVDKLNKSDKLEKGAQRGGAFFNLLNLLSLSNLSFKSKLRRVITLIMGITGILFLLFQTSTAAAASLSLSATEEKIRTYIAEQQQPQLALLETLVNVNSGTANLAGVRQVGKILQPQFESLGFKTRWAEEPSAMNRAGTLIAERAEPQHTQRKQRKRLLLIGHLDTVFPKDSAFQRFERHANSATGPGVIDDKGGIVVILYALKALQAVHALDNTTTLTVVLTGDEEDSGKPTSISRKPLIDVARRSDIALDFEWAITEDTATIARRGITNWRLEAHGHEAHSSEIFQPSAGDGAIFELARILHAMRSELAGEKYLSFNPGIVLGGTTVNEGNDPDPGPNDCFTHSARSQNTAMGKENVIAKTAIAKGDLRFLTQAQKTNAEKHISSIVSRHLPATTATISFKEGIPSMPPTAGNLALLKKYSEVSIDLGGPAIKPFDPGLRGAADISHIASMTSANLAGVGAMGTGAHSAKETLDIKSLPIQTQRAAILIYRLLDK